MKHWNGAKTFFLNNWNSTSHIFVKALKSQVQFWNGHVAL